jgi:hypothetical protein
MPILLRATQCGFIYKTTEGKNQMSALQDEIDRIISREESCDCEVRVIQGITYLIGIPKQEHSGYGKKACYVWTQTTSDTFGSYVAYVEFPEFLNTNYFTDKGISLEEVEQALDIMNSL